MAVYALTRVVVGCDTAMPSGLFVARLPFMSHAVS